MIKSTLALSIYHYLFYDSTHGWTNDVVGILQREVSWTRVREIVLQNDPALFRPKSKKMTGNSTTTFNVVNSQARKNTKCSSDLFFLKTNIDDGGPCRQSVNYFFCLQSVIFFLFCRQSEVFSPFVASRLTPFTPSCWNRFPQHKNIHFLFLPKELTAFDYHNILFFLILVKFSLTMRSFQGRCMYINRFLSELSLTHLYLIIIAQNHHTIFFLILVNV